MACKPGQRANNLASYTRAKIVGRRRRIWDMIDVNSLFQPVDSDLRFQRPRFGVRSGEFRSLAFRPRGGKGVGQHQTVTRSQCGGSPLGLIGATCLVDLRRSHAKALRCLDHGARQEQTAPM